MDVLEDDLFKLCGLLEYEADVVTGVTFLSCLPDDPSEDVKVEEEVDGDILPFM